MSIDQTLLDMNFEAVGVRNSQQRLRSLIAELAIEPLKRQHSILANDFERTEDVVQKRIAAVIGYWCENKHEPVVPSLRNKMSDITKRQQK
ncbi:hypothetical protein HC928_24950 [bacterium]|nr:hypothetical protein [bacterium]